MDKPKRRLRVKVLNGRTLVWTGKHWYWYRGLHLLHGTKKLTPLEHDEQTA